MLNTNNKLFILFIEKRLAIFIIIFFFNSNLIVSQLSESLGAPFVENFTKKTSKNKI